MRPAKSDKYLKIHPCVEDKVVSFLESSPTCLKLIRSNKRRVLRNVENKPIFYTKTKNNICIFEDDIHTKVLRIKQPNEESYETLKFNIQNYEENKKLLKKTLDNGGKIENQADQILKMFEALTVKNK